MPAFTTSAPGKVILFGEHAVVYGRPAIAVPVDQVNARATVMADPRGPSGRVQLVAPDIGLEADLADLPAKNPLARAVILVRDELGLSRLPAMKVRVVSTIPIAAGLGSGAAVSVALIRALSGFLGRPLPDKRVSELAFEIEKLHHGTPSGIDNTVVTWACPVFFTRGRPIKRLKVARPFTLVIGDTGVASPTARVVGNLRRAWEKDPQPYEKLFDAVGKIAGSARKRIEAGQPDQLGPLMDQNQEYLRQMGVSSPALERLIEAALQAGALGAKLSGGGRGGNMIALCPPNLARRVSGALRSAGAVRTIETTVRPG